MCTQTLHASQFQDLLAMEGLPPFTSVQQYQQHAVGALLTGATSWQARFQF